MLLHITPHITQNWGGDTAHEIVVRCSNLGGDTAQNSKTKGGIPHIGKLADLAFKRELSVAIR